MKIKKAKQKKKKTFKAVVEATPDVSSAYKSGLAALAGYRAKIEMGDTRKCGGSIDIDAAVAAKYPNDNRWDYALAYDGEVFFVEVHTAGTGEVDVVLRKLEWLKSWLHHHAPEINVLKATKKTPFYWIQSNGYHIAPNSKQERLIAQKGLRPISKLILNP